VTAVEARIGRHIIRRSSPVRVRGKQGAWSVVSIDVRDTGETFVEVVHAASGRSRIFPLDHLIYVRPSSKRGKDAAADRTNVRVVTAALVPAKPIRRRAPKKRAATS
jgi:hypothetical protein